MEIIIEHSKISSTGKSVVFIDPKFGNTFIKLVKFGIFFFDEKTDFDGTVISLDPEDISEGQNGWYSIQRFNKATFPNGKVLTWQQANAIKKDKIINGHKKEGSNKKFIDTDDWSSF